VTAFGYALPVEHGGPAAVIEAAVQGEAAGFDFEAIGDAFTPWLSEQGHAPNAWPLLGAIAHATSRVELMTFMTCPTMRYHPAVVAQLAATVALISEGRFTLGLSAGDNISEHPLGSPWPSEGTRLEMLSEAVEIIAALLRGQSVTVTGTHYRLEDARIWDVPPRFPAIAVAVTGSITARLAGARADAMLATAPDASLVSQFEDAGGIGAPRIGQLAVSYDVDLDVARARAHRLLRWRALDADVLAQAPNPGTVGRAAQYVRDSDVAAMIPSGPDPEPYVESVLAFVDAGFSHVSLSQAGGDQGAFVNWAGDVLLPLLRVEFG
jgi:G6PDH family F420-dependent oxidoreductase